MIRLNVTPGSPEWIAARIGIPTASQFDRILTPTGKPSAAAYRYMCDLIAESMLGAALDADVTEFMERGMELEEGAIRYYELQTDTETEPSGFCLRDDGRVGCTPDRLVGTDGGLEVKCPAPGVHVEHLLGMGRKYFVQVQGCLWVTGRSWWDLLSYHPMLPPAIVRVERDEAFIASLSAAVDTFLEHMGRAKEQLGVVGVKALA